MCLDKVIERLQEIRKKEGNIQVTTSDDYGIEFPLYKINVKQTIYRYNRNFSPNTRIIVIE